MKKLFAAAALGGAVALSLSACVSPTATPGDPGGSGGGGGDSDSIVIGIKFDQPGLGLRDGNTYKGFDVDVAKYVAKDLGYAEDKITFKESPSAQRETLISSGQVKLIFATYSITDTRKEQVSFGGPYLVAGQDLLVQADNTDITGPEALGGKKLCSVTGSTSAENVKKDYPDVQLQNYDTYSKCVQALSTGAIDAVTTDDSILAGFASQTQYQGKLKVVGKPFSTERYGIGLKKGDTELCTKVNDAVKKMIDDGSWQKALDDNLGPAGYKPNPEMNPPKEFESCS